MSETNTVTAEMYGIKVTGSPSQIAELKKLLDEQNPIKIKFIPQTQTYPLVVQPFIYPQPYTSPYWDTTKVYCTTTSGSIGSIQGVTAWNGDPKTNSINSTTSNDMSCIASSGSLVQNLYLTN